MYIGGKIENNDGAKGTNDYKYSYGRVTSSREVGYFNFTNSRTALCKIGTLAWGFKNNNNVQWPNTYLEDYESHDVWKAASMLGVSAMYRGTLSGNTENRKLTDFSDYDLQVKHKGNDLFEMYDLNMQTVLSDIEIYGLSSNDESRNVFDSVFLDVTRSTVITSAMTFNNLKFHPTSVPEQHRFKHPHVAHCSARNDLWSFPYSPCRIDCETNCPGTTYGSQISFFEIQDGSGVDVEGGAILGGDDREHETVNTHDWWKFEDNCTARFENWDSGGFMVCPTYGHRTAAGLSFLDIGLWHQTEGYSLRAYQEIVPGGPEEPVRHALNGTMYHWGNSSRRLGMQYGIVNVNGPCCDIGWYLSLDNGPLNKLAIWDEFLPVKPVKNNGLVFATSYPTGTSLVVNRCKRASSISGSYPGWDEPTCTPVNEETSLQAILEANSAAYFVDTTRTGSVMLIMKFKKEDSKQVSWEVGGVLQPQYRTRSNLDWYEIESSLYGLPQIMDLPDALESV